MTLKRKIGGLFHQAHTARQAVSVLFLTVLISNVLGLLRNVIIANRVGVTYGTIGPLDNYYAAFLLPDFLYSILIVGALSSAILPLLVKIDTENDDKKFWRTYNLLLSTGLTIMVFGLIILYFVLPPVITYLFPGFTAQNLDQTIKLAQAMLLSPLFFTVSQLASSALQAKRRFLAPAIAPIVYNLSIITAALFIPQFGLTGLVYGVVVGAALHFLVQLPSLLALGWRFQFTTGFRDSYVGHVVKLMIPRTIALTSTQLLLIAFYRIASGFHSGAISIYKLTDDLQTAPVLLLANSLAMAVLPDFARHVARDEHNEFVALVSKALRLILFIFVPVTIFLLLYRLPIIHLYISIGHRISEAEVATTVTTFSYFVISLFFQGAVLLLVRAYFARADTFRPTFYVVISLVVAWVIAKVLAAETDLGVPGLALAFSVGSFLNAVLLWVNLRLPLRSLTRDANNQANLLPVLFGGILAAIFFWLAKITFESMLVSLELSPSVGYLLTVIGGLAAGSVVYLAWAKMCNLEQWHLIRTRNSTGK